MIILPFGINIKIRIFKQVIIMHICSQDVSLIHSDIRGENYLLSLEMEKRGERILKLNTGNPAAFGFNMPDSVRSALIEKLDMALGYCDVRGMLSAREAIMKYHQSKNIKDFSLDDIFIGNGVSEISSMIATVLFDKGDEVLLPMPCYSLWNNEVALRGAVPVFYNCNESENWSPDTEHIKSLINNKTKAILIINPNNPTGVLYSDAVLLEIIEIAQKNNLIILSDEIYDRLVFDGKTHKSIASMTSDLIVITMNGLSKSHCLCGFRCGWLVVSGPCAPRKQISDALLKIASIRLSANALMQTIIPDALNDAKYTESLIVKGGRLYEQRKAAFEELDKVEGLSYIKNDAAFYVFPKIKSHIKLTDDKLFAKRLLIEKNILIVPGSGFCYKKPDHFRIVMLPEPETLSLAVKKIGEFIDQL